jgi:hypothetical protein
VNRAMLIAGLLLIASPAHAEPAPFSPWPQHLFRRWKEKEYPVYRWVEPTRDPRLPPLKYDREYTGKMIVKRGTLDEVKAACFRNYTILGCAFRHDAIISQRYGEFPATCDVWIVNDDVLEKYNHSYDIVFRHEQGHCNGWIHMDYNKPPFEARY